MLFTQKGSVSRVILACVIVMAFCFALAWPKYSKQRNAKQLAQAAELSKALAFAEGSYKQAHGSYTPNFEKLNLSLPCPTVTRGRNTVLECPHYTYQLQEESLITATHKTLPIWLEVDIAQGSVQCKYDEDDWAGQDLCARLQ